MKILFLVSGSIRSNFSYRPLALARSLANMGHMVSIVTPKADKYNDFKPEKIEKIDGVTILQPFQFATRRLEINLIPYLFGAARLVSKERPDLIYIYKPTPISVIGLIGRFFYGIQTVADFDDLGSEVMRIEGHPWYQRLLVAWSERMAVRYSDRVVVASNYLLNVYREKFPKKQFLHMPNGVEQDWLDAPIMTKASERIIFFGSINRKNILDPLFACLPDVIGRYPDLKVVIIGDGKYLSYFKEKALAENISKNVTFTGWLTLDIAKSQLYMGDIGYNYMPNEITTQAASNMKVPQYMSRGVAPLVSGVGDLPATVDLGNAGYICKTEDVQSVKSMLIYALRDPDRLRKAERARAIATTKLNWNHLAQSFEKWIMADGQS